MRSPLEVYRRYHLSRDSRVEEAITRMQQIVDALLDHCPDMECFECGKIICPHKDSFHFHHDGCPSCAEHEHPDHIDVGGEK